MFEKIIFLSVFFIAVSCRNSKTPDQEGQRMPFYRDKKELTEHLGTCGEKIDYYYNIGAKYPLSSKDLISKIQSQKFDCNSQDNGYLTLNFVVNCYGKPNNIIVYQIDNSFEKTQFTNCLVSRLENFVLNLEDFKSFEDLNYHYYFTFILKNGKIIDILP